MAVSVTGELFDPGPPIQVEHPEADWSQAVELRHVRDHAYEGAKGRGKRCPRCGHGKSNMVHIGYPASLNISGSAGVAMAYQSAKKSWEAVWADLLAKSGLPKGLARVDAEGQICFPDRRKRDQGNFRYMLEKSLGDVLTCEGYLPDDSWDFYEFGNLRRAYDRGQAWTVVTIFPTLP